MWQASCVWAFIGMLDDGWLSDVEVSVVGSAWQQNQTLPLITHYARIYQWAIGALSPSAPSPPLHTPSSLHIADHHSVGNTMRRHAGGVRPRPDTSHKRRRDCLRDHHDAYRDFSPLDHHWYVTERA